MKNKENKKWEKKIGKVIKTFAMFFIYVTGFFTLLPRQRDEISCIDSVLISIIFHYVDIV